MMDWNPKQAVELDDLSVFVEDDGDHVLTARLNVRLPLDGKINAARTVTVKTRTLVSRDQDTLAEMTARIHADAIAILRQAVDLLEATTHEDILPRMANPKAPLFEDG